MIAATSHNIAFALLDPKNVSFQKTKPINLDGTCDDCNNILFVVEAVQKIVNENSENQDLQYDNEAAIEAIFWLHQVFDEGCTTKESQRICIFTDFWNCWILVKRY